MPLARIVGIGPALTAELDHGRVVEPAQPAVVRVDPRVEEGPAVDGVGVAAVDQLRDQADHLIHMLGRARRSVDREESDLRHIVVEHSHLLRGQLSEIDLALARNPKDVVIDIGDIAHASHTEPRVAKTALEHIEHVIDEGMTEVRRVIGCDAADVDADTSVPRLEGHHLLAGGVEQLHAVRFYGALDGAPRGCSCSSTPRAASSTAMLSLKLRRVLASSKRSHAASAISLGSGRISVPSGASTMK